jgi:hypothetical protein
MIVDYLVHSFKCIQKIVLWQEKHFRGLLCTLPLSQETIPVAKKNAGENSISDQNFGNNEKITFR